MAQKKEKKAREKRGEREKDLNGKSSTKTKKKSAPTPAATTTTTINKSGDTMLNHFLHTHLDAVNEESHIHVLKLIHARVCGSKQTNLMWKKRQQLLC